jgi:hypothetical protein
VSGVVEDEKYGLFVLTNLLLSIIYLLKDPGTNGRIILKCLGWWVLIGFICLTLGTRGGLLLTRS